MRVFTRPESCRATVIASLVFLWAFGIGVVLAVSLHDGANEMDFHQAPGRSRITPETTRKIQ